MTIVVNTHEPAAGFSADAYARIRGLGGVLVTFGAGGLNMINAIAQAYAERSPVIVMSGAPEIQGRRTDALLHHKVRTFETQLNVYKEVTGCAIALEDAASARESIDRVFEATMRTKRPGYIEVPRDLTELEIGNPVPPSPLLRANQSALRETMDEVVTRLNNSERLVVYAGVEIQRFGLRSKLLRLVKRLGVPVITSIEGKAVFPEDDPHFIGIYMGQAGSRQAMHTVEQSDCILMLGAQLTDVNTGIYTARIDRSKVVFASAESVTVGYHTYSDVTLEDLIDHLLESRAIRRRVLAHETTRERQSHSSPRSPSGKLDSTSIIEELNNILNPAEWIITSDVGDCLYAAVDLRVENFLGPGYYNSMGFGIPAAIAAQLAAPNMKVLGLVGDGAFEMTGLELSTANSLGVRPIIILFRNSRYGTLQAIDGKRPYFELQTWDFVKIAKALGGDGVRVKSIREFREAMKVAESSNKSFLIEAIVGPGMSSTWRRIAEQVRVASKRGSDLRTKSE